MVEISSLPYAPLGLSFTFVEDAIAANAVQIDFADSGVIRVVNPATSSVPSFELASF
jgi:hypothetical protein